MFVCLVFLGGVPYFPGGLHSVEYYDITTNKWHAASRMPWRSLTVKCVPVGDVIFVLAGDGLGAQCLTNVLEYHTKTNRLVHQLNTVDINYIKMDSTIFFRMSKHLINMNLFLVVNIYSQTILVALL